MEPISALSTFEPMERFHSIKEIEEVRLLKNYKFSRIFKIQATKSSDLINLSRICGILEFIANVDIVTVKKQEYLKFLDE